MVWQKIDDQFGVSKKIIRIPKRRRHQCVGLWTLAGNYSVRALTDGVLEAHELEELDSRQADVDELVRVNLWHGHGHSCDSCPPAPEGGAVIHDFLIYNPSRAKVEGDREAARVRKASQRDKQRGHSGTRGVTPAGRNAESAPPVPSRPGPDPLDQDLTTDPPDRNAGAGDDLGLNPTIAAVVASVRDHGISIHPLAAADVVAFIDYRRDQGTPVRVPTKYYPDAIAGSWPEVEKFIFEEGLAS